MHHLSPVLACMVLAASFAAAATAQQIPSSVLPGRERDRFTESPVERFMQPGPYTPPPVVEVRPGACPKPPHSKARPAKRKSC